MNKKPIIIRIRNFIIERAINPIKYHNVKWCFDESECMSKSKICDKCPYYQDSNK